MASTITPIARTNPAQLSTNSLRNISRPATAQPAAPVADLVAVDLNKDSTNQPAWQIRQQASIQVLSMSSSKPGTILNLLR